MGLQHVLLSALLALNSTWQQGAKNNIALDYHLKYGQNNHPEPAKTESPRCLDCVKDFEGVCRINQCLRTETDVPVNPGQDFCPDLNGGICCIPDTSTTTSTPPDCVQDFNGVCRSCECWSGERDVPQKPGQELCPDVEDGKCCVPDTLTTTSTKTTKTSTTGSPTSTTSTTTSTSTTTTSTTTTTPTTTETADSTGRPNDSCVEEFEGTCKADCLPDEMAIQGLHTCGNANMYCCRKNLEELCHEKLDGFCRFGCLFDEKEIEQGLPWCPFTHMSCCKSDSSNTEEMACAEKLNGNCRFSCLSNEKPIERGPPYCPDVNMACCKADPSEQFCVDEYHGACRKECTSFERPVQQGNPWCSNPDLFCCSPMLPPPLG